MKTFTFTLSFNVDLYEYKDGYDESFIKHDIDGQIAQITFPHSLLCKTCGMESEYECSRCKSVAYCSEECQKIDWPIHKSICKMNAKMHEAINIAISNENVPGLLIDSEFKPLIPVNLREKIRYGWDNYKLIITATIKGSTIKGKRYNANQIADKIANNVRKYFDLLFVSDDLDYVFYIKKSDLDAPIIHEIFTMLSLHDITIEEGSKLDPKLAKKEKKIKTSVF
jgi:hypothetical protein